MDVITEAVKRTILAHTQYSVNTHTVNLDLNGVTASYGDDKIVVSGDSFAVDLTAEDELDVTVTMGGKNITSSVYANGTITIPSVTDDVIITAKSVHIPKSYCWEFNGTDLVCVCGNNDLTKNAGTTTNGVLDKTRYALQTSVQLLHDQPWVVEWKSEGTFKNTSGSGARVFTSDDVNANYNARYIFKSSVDWLIAMGEKDTNGSHNYGIALADYGIDGSAKHTYRLENRIADDGSNMVWLLVDGEEIGPMNHYYIGTKDQNTTSDWLSGKDFVFPYMGTDTHGFTNASINYIQVWEGGHNHTYENGTCTGCGATVSPYLQQLPENILGCTNLYDSLVPVKGYYTATKYDTSNGAVLSVVIPVEPGDRIAASSFGSVSENMGSVNGIRVTYLLGDEIVTSLSAGDVYSGYTSNGYLTVPDGVNAVCVPWWKPSDSNWLTLGQISKDFAVHITKTVPAQAPTCTDKGYTAGEICEICNASLGEREEIPPTGHSYSGDTCTVCGTVNLLAFLDGKYVSVLGDSISTFNGYSNDATVNTTIGENGPRYDAGTSDTKPGSYCLLESVNDTWWMHFANRSGMNLLVNNSWAGSQVFGGQTSDGRVIPAAYLDRCVNLHDNTLENNPGNAPINPDVIFVYLGINDYNFNRGKVGTGTVDYAGLVDSDATYVTPETFGEAYGIMLHKMRNAYPDAQIFAMTLLPENLYSVDKTAWEQHNAYIRAAAEYYDIPVVDLAENCAITWEDYSGYMIDKIHPTTAGMELISDCVEAELVAYYQENPSHTHSYTSVVTAPTCTAEGYTTYTCKCGDSYTADRVKALGHDYKSVVTKPTCTEPGHTTYTCSRCADTYTGNRTAALGHDYKSVVTKPTCEAEGYTTNTCSRCADSYTSNKTPATGHKWDNGKVTKEPTEEVNGEKTFTCTVCKKTRTEVVPALEHTHKYTEKVTAPTCTAQGYTTYTCACGESYTDDFVKALGHSYGKWTVSKAATCEEDGEDIRSCTRCQETFTRSTEALGHDYKAVVTKPTCTEQGYTTHTCARCADSYVDSKTAALGHSWDNGIVTKEPTEETTGLRLYTCTTCGETKTEVIAELTHTHSYTATVTAPTCLEKGYTTHTCKCGHSYTSDEKAALGHSYGSWTVSKAATCTAKGEEHRDCTRCDAYETRALNALGHSYKATVVNPTCEAAGYTVHECTRCADSYRDTETAATGHSWNSGEVTKEPTEKNPGEKTFTCTVCKKTRTEVIPALGHTHRYTKSVTAPTCLEEGYTTYTCTCGHSYKDTYTEPLGHNYTTSVTNPTCTAQGYTTYLCNRCSSSYVGDYVPAKGHAEVIDKAVEATCMESGLTEGRHCGLCDAVIVQQQAIPAKGHTWDSGKVTKEPTESASGLKIFTCKTCGETRNETIPALGHTHNYTKTVTAPTCTAEGYTTYTCKCGDTYTADRVKALGHDYKSVVTKPTCTEPSHTTYTCSRCADTYTGNRTAALGHDYKSVVTKPTCEAEGYTTNTCSRCADSYTSNKTPATGHKWDNGKVTKEPTEEVNGEKTFTCTVCKKTRTEVIPALEHTHKYTEVITKPTCTEQGYTTYTCACGESYTDDFVKALGHSYGKWTVSKAATCEENGEETRTCTRCSHAEKRSIEALGHDYKAVVTKPTCTEQGYTTHTCARCSDSYVDSKTAALGHSWDNGIVTKEPTEETTGLRLYTCTTCGETKTEVIAELTHTHNYTAAVTAPTCLEKGYTTHTCKCGHSYRSDEKAALGHSYGSWTVSKVATCTAKGEEHRDCTHCDAYETRALNALGHSYKATVVNPTCEAAGYTVHECTRCADSYRDTETAATGHSWNSGEVTKEPTEKNPGEKTFTCTVCGKTRTEVIPALGHTHKYTETVTAPTCTTQGYTTYTCQCGHSYKDAYREALGHDYKTTVTTPTCTEKGYTTYVCSRCSDKYIGNYVDAKGHTEVIDKAIAATCTTAGKTEGKHCSVCNTVIVKQETVPVTGHTWDSGKVTKEPTEETTGTRTYTCTACGEIRTEEIPVKNHMHDYTANVIEPSCAVRGITVYVCSCGDSYEYHYVDPLGHDYVFGKKDATCTESGVYTMDCARCGDHQDYGPIPSKGHGWSNWTVTKPATKEAEGEKQRVCSICGEYETQSIPKLEPEKPSNPFIDLVENKFYFDAVLWAVEKGITTGTSDTTFEPEGDCTRKQIVTFLWRAAGKPEPETMESPFKDVSINNQFAKAILWAVELEITNGTGDGTTFSPNDPCTRKQIVTFLWRAVGKPEPKITENPFEDVKSDRFEDAILWAYSEGITTGKTETTFQPEATCTRGQIVTFLYRYITKEAEIWNALPENERSEHLFQPCF